MKPFIKKLDVDPQRRIICISDIHNEIGLFKELLKKIDFNDNDYLIINGDFLERGRSYSNIEVLHYFMDLSKLDNVFIITGNSDYVWPMMSRTKKPWLYIDFLLKNDNNLVGELLDRIGYKVSEDSDCYEIAKLLIEHYPNEWKFLTSLPQIIETDKYIFVHGGLYPDKEDYCDELYQLMKYDNFEGRGYKFEKYVIVGHWPVSNYATTTMSFNPRIREDLHIISIDGGNVVKNAGQLNAFIIRDDKFSFTSIDNLKEIVIQEDYKTTNNKEPLSINWYTAEIKILKRYPTYSHIYHYATKKETDIPNSFIYEREGKAMSDDITNVHINVQKGDKVKLVSLGQDYSLVKKDGVLGWIKNSSFISR